MMGEHFAAFDNWGKSPVALRMVMAAIEQAMKSKVHLDWFSFRTNGIVEPLVSA
jgi:hypothetical protein